MSSTSVIDLIDRQALADELNSMADCAEAVNDEEATISVSDALRIVYGQASQTDYQMVQHGKWIDGKLGDTSTRFYFTCDRCGWVIWGKRANYCPCCGAKMDAEGDVE